MKLKDLLKLPYKELEEIVKSWAKDTCAQGCSKCKYQVDLVDPAPYAFACLIRSVEEKAGVGQDLTPDNYDEAIIEKILQWFVLKQLKLRR